MRKIILIALVDLNNGIGSNGTQPIFIKNDLERFKNLTETHTVVMGRKTHEAIPGGKLKNRRNVILSRNKDYKADGCEVYSSKDEVLVACENDEKVFIIGGGEVYNMFIDDATDILLTRVYHKFEDVDTYFPTIDVNKWRELFYYDNVIDEKCKYRYQYETYERSKYINKVIYDKKVIIITLTIDDDKIIKLKEKLDIFNIINTIYPNNLYSIIIFNDDKIKIKGFIKKYSSFNKNITKDTFIREVSDELYEVIGYVRLEK